MSTLMAIFSYPGGSDTLQRHWKYFKQQDAQIWGIGTTDGECRWPDDMTDSMDVGINSYISGSHLPQRMVDTICNLLDVPWDILILCEYDTLILRPIEVANLAAPLASHCAGNATWGSKVSRFYHNPWVMKRSVAHAFVEAGQKAIDEGICGAPTHNEWARPEGSPDVFFAYVADKLGVTVQDDLWTEYTQNDLKDPDRLAGARAAYWNDIDIIHGVKTKEELAYILS